MGSPDELDILLASGSTRPARVEVCVDETAIDDGDLLAYRQGRLGADRESVERHLIACPFCRDLVAHLHVPRRSLRWPALAGGAFAAIAAAVLFFFAPPPRERIGDYVATPRGFVAHERSKPDSESREYRPTSQVSIKVEPKHGRAAAQVRAFRVDGGVLIPIDAEIELGVDGVFILKGSGRTFFGDASGEQRLVIVAADEGADLSTISGRTPQAAASITSGVVWLPEIVVDYRMN